MVFSSIYNIFPGTFNGKISFSSYFSYDFTLIMSKSCIINIIYGSLKYINRMVIIYKVG